MAPSESFAAVLRQQRMNYDISIWSRGVERDLFNPARRDLAWRRALGIADDEVVIGFFSRLVMEKGLDVFADAIDALRAGGQTPARPFRVLIVGEGPARQIFLRGQPLDAAHAHRIGLVDEVVDKGAALDRALAIAAEYADMAPVPLAMVKNWMSQGLAEALDWERNAQSAMFLTADHIEGRDAFLARRKPIFTGR